MRIAAWREALVAALGPWMDGWARDEMAKLTVNRKRPILPKYQDRLN
jgi:hypothetical protein